MRSGVSFDMALFRGGPPPFHTALAMVAAKPGQRVLVAGPGDPDLSAEIALATGLNGETVVLAADASAQKTLEAAAARAGALVVVQPWHGAGVPVTVDPFDVVVLHGALADAASAARTVSDAFRAVRPGGRVVAIEGAARAASGLRLWRSAAPMRPAADVLALFEGAGFRGARVLAEVAGARYIEGIKARP